jgi:acyl-CoA synthetase (AMP-forming)/AMP-acid ligase II
LLTRTETSSQKPATLVDLLRGHATERGDKLAFAFLEDGANESERLTYAELDRHARRIAASLQASLTPGDRALLLFPAGLDFLKAFFGCLYAGLIAIPAPAPEASRRKRTMPRLQAIARDADVKVVLSTGDTLALIKDAARDVPAIEAARLVDVREIPDGGETAWRPPAIQSSDLAYLQYTSGSTTDPKGVMLSHRNVLHHCRDIGEACAYGPDSISVTWLPYFHDYGLIEGLLVPLQNGTPSYIMSPFAFLKRPFAWLNAMSRLKATHTQAPSFAYDQCVRRIKPEQLAQLDLSSLVSAGNGSEPVNPLVLGAFFETFGPRGFRREALCPAYGLAEATLMMSCKRPSEPPRVGNFRADALGDGQVIEATSDSVLSRSVTSCGPALGNIKIAIVDPMTKRRCAPDGVGEIWISDPCVALGYWKRKEATEETFNAFTSDTNEGPFLRTGDLGFLKDGELYITSRIKDLIIVAGANHYPQDIEWTVERCHPAVRANHVAANSVYEGGEERLLVAPEVERGSLDTPEDVQALLAAIRRAIAEAHELQVYAILVLNRGSLPKTASGKIRRHSCARLLSEDGDEVLARWTADKGLERVRVRETVTRAE